MRYFLQLNSFEISFLNTKKIFHLDLLRDLKKREILRLGTTLSIIHIEVQRNLISEPSSALQKMDILRLDFLLLFLKYRSLPLPSLQIPIDIWAWFGEWRDIKSLNHLITRTWKESEKKWSELSLNEISRLMIRYWSFRQMKQLEEINLTWSMEQKSTTSKIFNKKTDLNVSFFFI